MARLPNSDRQVDAILLVARELHGILEQLTQKADNNAILERLAEMEKKIMGQLTEYSEAVNAKFSEIGDSVDGFVSSLAGVSADVTFLKDALSKIDNTPGPLSPEDQALLTSSLNRLTGLADRVKKVAEAAKALDDSTEPSQLPPVPEQP